jgi:hypothetical protein
MGCKVAASNKTMPRSPAAIAKRSPLNAKSKAGKASKQAINFGSPSPIAKTFSPFNPQATKRRSFQRTALTTP